MIQCTFEEEIDLPGGGFRHTKCINEAKILVISDSCYGLCYMCAYDKLKVENKKLKKVIEDFGSNPAGFDWVVLGRIDELEIENEELKELLIEYGRHQPGCCKQYNKKYPCRCGWDKVRIFERIDYDS